MRGTVIVAKGFSTFVTVLPDDAKAAEEFNETTFDSETERGCAMMRNGGALTYWIHRERLRVLGVVELLAELADVRDR